MLVMYRYAVRIAIVNAFCSIPVILLYRWTFLSTWLDFCTVSSIQDDVLGGDRACRKCGINLSWVRAVVYKLCSGLW